MPTIRPSVVMTDRTAPLSFYHLRTGSRIIMLIDTTSARPAPPTQAEQRRANERQQQQQQQQQQQEQQRQQQQQRQQSGYSRNPSAPAPQQYGRPLASTPSSASQSRHGHSHSDGPTVSNNTNAEQMLINRITDHLDQARSTVLPIFEEFKAQASSFTSTPSPTPAATHKHLNSEHAKVAELLLQSLMKVDGVEIPSEFTEARAKRKEAVRLLQGRMDEADGIKERVTQAAKDYQSNL
ncbi:hypothetical protein BC831DRAFT_249212 [Entophlyctis helioformis]|nr:hypothetical protein BC831DRAFT_249212 [Entophlyctis helioformis]